MNAEALGFVPALSIRTPRQPRQQSTIDHRWESYWLARAAASSKLSDDPADAFHRLHSTYLRRIDHLLTAGIAWTTILRGDLDSPLRIGPDFDRILSLAIVRRNSRMNRTKGIVKGKRRK
jgi:hypothetical protein